MTDELYVIIPSCLKNSSICRNHTEPLPLGEWFYELIWCPSQCYYHLQHNGADYILYLRWRHENPWQACVVRNAANLDEMHADNAVWSEDIFELNDVQYADDEIELAKETAIKFFCEFKGEVPERKRIYYPK